MSRDDEKLLKYFEINLEYYRIRARLEREYRAELESLQRENARLLAEYDKMRTAWIEAERRVNELASALPPVLPADFKLNGEIPPGEVVWACDGDDAVWMREPAPPTAAYEAERDVSADDEIGIAYAQALRDKDA